MSTRGGLVMGIDLATKCGITEGYAGQTPHLIHSVNFGRSDDDLEDVLGRALFWISNRLLDNLPDAIGIEAPIPAFGKQGKTQHKTTQMLTCLFGVFVAVAKCKCIPCYPIEISSWRKDFLGAGNGRLKREVAKPMALARCKQLGWPCPELDEDAAESAGVWHHTAGKVIKKNLFERSI